MIHVLKEKYGILRGIVIEEPKLNLGLGKATIF